MESGSDKIENSDLRKCGDITTLLSIGKNEFFLNCGFCNYTFCQLDNFIQHICEEHSYQFTIPKLEEPAGFSLDFEEEIDGVDAQMQEDCAPEEADEYNASLRNFERVEVEFNETVINDSIEQKEASFDSFDESYNENLEQSVNHTDSETAQPEKSSTSKEDAEFAANMKILDLGLSFDRQLLLEIFACYEYRPALWDAEVPAHAKLREREIKAIAREVGIPKEWESVRKLFAKLGSRLRTEMIRKKIYKSKGKQYIVAWITDLNSFIKLRKPLPQTKGRQTEISTPPPKGILNDEQLIILSDTYKEFPTLWNEKDITYRFSNRRREAAQKLLDKYNEIVGLRLRKYDLENEISRIRKICSMEKKRKILCKRQDKTYTPNCKFYDRIRFLENDVQPYECFKCGKLIGGPIQYKVHMAEHDGHQDQPFQCDICENRFKFMPNFIVHLRRHAQDFVYSCKVCNKLWATTTELKIHMRSHTDERPFVCEVCGNKFRSSSDLKSHMTSHDVEPRYKCDVCEKLFFKKQLLSEHMHSHRKVRDKICNICDKAFASKKHLRQHKQIHVAKKKYVCKICDKRFAQYAGLSGHVRLHGTTLVEINSKNVDSISEYFKNINTRASSAGTQRWL